MCPPCEVDLHTVFCVMGNSALSGLGVEGCPLFRTY